MRSFITPSSHKNCVVITGSQIKRLSFSNAILVPSIFILFYFTKKICRKSADFLSVTKLKVIADGRTERGVIFVSIDTGNILGIIIK